MRPAPSSAAVAPAIAGIRLARESSVAALMSPVTFKTVLKMSGIVSTASAMMIPSMGSPAAR